MSDELRTATERVLFRQLVDLSVTVIGLAVETHGDILRHALSQVFDLCAVEQQERNNAALITAQGERLQRLDEATHEAEMRLKRLTKRIEDAEVRESVPF